MKDPERNSSPMVEVAVAVLLREGRVWLQQRRGTGHLDGLWEFPGGKVEAGESPLQALLREVREEVDLELPMRRCRLFKVVKHQYPDRQVKLHFFLCPLDGRPTLKASALRKPGKEEAASSGAGRRLARSDKTERGWFQVGELDSLPLPPANRSVIQELQRYCAE